MSTSSLTDRCRNAFRLPRLKDARELLTEVREIQSSFRKLERSISCVDELIATKYRMQHWRMKVFELAASYLETSYAKGTPDDFAALHILMELEFKTDSPRLCSWIKRVRETGHAELISETAHLAAELAAHDLLKKLFEPDAVPSEFLSLAGPSRKLPIVANAPSRTVFSRWSNDPEFSNYAFSEENEELSVHYRGLSFKAGDLLVSNVNRDGNGVYTALQSPRSYAYHLGVVAILPGVRRVPVVLEGYKLGVRAVPLSTFLSSKFNSYVEVCRLRKRPLGFHSRLNAEATRLPETVKGYNFDTEDPDHRYLSCTTVATCLYQRAGVQPLRTKSCYHPAPQVRRNLSIFEFGMSNLFSLTDIIVDDRIEVIGAVDNGHFVQNIARELCERTFLTVFGSGELDLGKLPMMFTLNRFGIQQLRAGTILGTLLGLPYGLHQGNMPKGPEKVLAIIELYEHMLESAVKRLVPVLRQHCASSSLMEIDQLTADTDIGETLEISFKNISRAYRPARSPEQAVALD